MCRFWARCRHSGDPGPGGCIDDWVTAAAAEAAEAAELQLLEAQARCEHAASSLRHANAMHTH